MARTLQIDAGPMATPAQPQQWSAPDGVHLLHNVSIETLVGPGRLALRPRARIALPEFAKANVRTEGRRVYVDLTWPLDEEDARGAAANDASTQEGIASSARAERVRQCGGEARSSDGRHRRRSAYREAIEPIHQRISEVRPFLSVCRAVGID